jgi:type VI secretion system lysozyme-like protein
MANVRLLLQRLRDPDPVGLHTMQFDRRTLVASIADNLRQILNTRQGSAPAQMDLGIPAPCEIVLAIPQSIDTLKRTIIAVIDKYEPRLTHVQAYYQPSPVEGLVLNFLITARLAYDGGQISFATRFDKGGIIYLDA